jgi:phosphopantothenoylcysteine decarboxylase / phosphopantothenate---cysteine ligase
MLLENKKILIGITGSIAAYKIPFLIRLLIKEGAEVKVVMTQAAFDFVTPLTLSTLTHSPVLSVPFNSADGSWNSHVDWGNWADIYLIAPASANTIAKMANGITDNLLTAIYLAAKCPVFFAPAMDVDMYQHPSTQANIARLQTFGNKLIAPQTGELASGLSGAGRLEEPIAILDLLTKHFKQIASLKGKNVLITAGPTHEAIDPVRYLGNHSSGKMGFALAEEAALRGASVTLISGPTAIMTNNPNITLVNVVNAQQMYEACHTAFTKSDIIIMAAAVADYKPKKVAENKIKKSDQSLLLELESTKDILKSLGKIKTEDQILVGFALETENREQNALKKLNEKNLDFVVLNSSNEPGSGFGHDTNKVTIIQKNGLIKEFSLRSKRDVASDIFNSLDFILENKA